MRSSAALGAHPARGAATAERTGRAVLVRVANLLEGDDAAAVETRHVDVAETASVPAGTARASALSPRRGGRGRGGRRGGHAIGVVRRTAGGERGVVPAGRVRLRRRRRVVAKAALRGATIPGSDGSARGERAVPPVGVDAVRGRDRVPPREWIVRVGAGRVPPTPVRRRGGAAGVALLLRALIRHAKVAGRAARGFLVEIALFVVPTATGGVVVVVGTVGGAADGEAADEFPPRAPPRRRRRRRAGSRAGRRTAEVARVARSPPW